MLLKIVRIPDPILRQVAKPVEVFDAELQTLIDNMFETMYEAMGAGLAAPQIGKSFRLAVIGINGKEYVLINPKIISAEGNIRYSEGCLSVPNVVGEVDRAEKVTIEALDRHGKAYTLTADDFLAACIQHEIEHLNGRLIVDYMSPLKRSVVRRKLKKIKKNT